MSDPIIVVPYNPEWPRQFAALGRRLRPPQNRTRPTIPRQPAGLGRLFWLNGLLYWMGRPTFCISPFIADYHGLMQTLREKRPDLFYT